MKNIHSPRHISGSRRVKRSYHLLCRDPARYPGRLAGRVCKQSMAAAGRARASDLAREQPTFAVVRATRRQR